MIFKYLSYFKTKPSFPFSLFLTLSLVSGQACARDSVPSISRTNVRSPEFFVGEENLGFYMSYSGFKYTDREKGEGDRFLKPAIGAKAMDMIEKAEKLIVASVFLFDSMDPSEDHEVDIVGQFTELLVRKRQENPELRVAVILDLSHRTYTNRIAPAVQRFMDNGIDVFYSDVLVGLKRGTFDGLRQGVGYINRGLNFVTMNGWGNLMSATFSRIPLTRKVEMEGKPVSIATAFNGILGKVNHRKLLVTDVGGDGYEALVSSANPHNPSYGSVNTAVSVKGELAPYIYQVMRRDIQQSIRLGKQYCHWNTQADRAYKKNYLDAWLPDLPWDSGKMTAQGDKGSAGVTFVTESEIGKAVLDLLRNVKAGDEVRIQMFYLSFQPVIDAILDASTVVEKPIRLLLDPSKDSFNQVRDGTPNRQAARYMMREAQKRGGKLEIRWYSTHGEQNHAKIMTITNPVTGKKILTTGSCNWTGRNMNGVNMESNVVVANAAGITTEFNDYFELFWSNSDGNEYSLDYEAYPEVAGDWKWRMGEAPFYYNTF